MTLLDLDGYRLASPSSLLTSGNFAAALITYVLAYAIFTAVRRPSLPSSIPWVGTESQSWLAKLKASFKCLVHYKRWNHEGYEKHNKADRSCIVPNLPGMAAEIILPPSQFRWFFDQPDNVLSAQDAHSQALHGDYSFITPHILKDPYHEHVIHRNLARNLTGLIPEVEDEVKHAVDTGFGLDEENWKSVNLWNLLLDHIIPLLTNRMIIGMPVCRNKQYLTNMIGFTNNVIRNLVLLGATPVALKPIVGSIARLPGWYCWRQTSHHSLSIIKQRLHDMAKKSAGDPAYKDWNPPSDYITWHIAQATKDGRIDELDPVRISMRLTPLNFASIHTTTITSFGVLIDLLSSDPSKGYLDGLSEECTRVWAEEGGVATKDGLSRLFRTDSAIRESMRFSTFAQTGSGRMVVAEEGLTNPAEGWHAPKGTVLSVNLYNILHDPDVHANPYSYDAFRFSREREEWEAKAVKPDQAETLRIKQTGLVTTGDTFMPFGHGRHACPGRFFVAHELKMLFSYLLRHYDFKPLSKRPETKWIGANMIPATDTIIEVRRKKGTSNDVK